MHNNNVNDTVLIFYVAWVLTFFSTTRDDVNLIDLVCKIRPKTVMTKFVNVDVNLLYSAQPHKNAKEKSRVYPS